jgi:hypothetical protein
MRLTAITPGHIVRVGDSYHCFVLERGRGRQRIRGICATDSRAPRRVKARDVHAHRAKSPTVATPARKPPPPRASR